MQIGTYEVLRELGRGGMGTVYLARAVGPAGVQRLVAIKRPHREREQSTEVEDRFLEEARITAQVHHANVVGMHQAGIDDDGYFLVFDYVEGESLGELVDRARQRSERVPEGIVIRIVMDALAGLHAAHEARSAAGEPLGILHRDVSPQNLLVGRDGVTRLTDFGIAKSTASALVTDQRYVRGKFAFMSPEYLQRLPVDRTMDVYAMGVTLWVALTGTGPWAGYDEPQLIHAILLEGVPALTGVPAPLAEVVNTACRSDAGQRYQTARQMLEALEAARAAAGATSTHFDVAEYLESVAGPDLDARREAVASAPSSAAGAPPPPPPSPAEMTEFHWQKEEPAPAPPGPDTGELLRSLSLERRSSRSVLAYSILALAAAGGAFFVMNRSGDVPEERADAVAPRAASAPASAAVAPRPSLEAPSLEPASAPASDPSAPDSGATSAPPSDAKEVPREASRRPVAAPGKPRPGRPSAAPSNKPFLPFSPSNPYR